MDTRGFEKVKLLAEFTRNDIKRVQDIAYSNRWAVPETAKNFTRDLLELDEITVEAIQDLYNSKYKRIDTTGDYMIIKYVFIEHFKN